MKLWKTGFLAVLLAASLTTGCGAADSGMSEEIKETAVMDYEANDEIYPEEMSVAEEPMEAETEILKIGETDRKLIRTVDIQIQTKEFDQVVEGIQTKVQELGGYIEQSSLDSGSGYYEDYNRYSNMTVRIPSDQLDSFVENVKENANVTSLSESAEDITLSYVDTESRKKALETEQERLMTLLEQAETVEDIITIEGRLSEVRYQLESYTSQLRTYDNQVDYSTVRIGISEVEREVKAEQKGFWDEVKENFGNSWYHMGQGFRSFAIWFLGSSPYLLLWAALIGGAVAGIRFVVKKRKNRKNGTETK